MLKGALLRHARLCHRVAPGAFRSVAVGSRSALLLRAPPRPQPWSSSRWPAVASTLRLYSTATAEATSDGQAAATGRVTRFADLASFGVHQNLVSAVTERMGYEHMTDVQSMAIMPALSGKDMLVASVPHIWPEHGLMSAESRKPKRAQARRWPS